MEGPTQISTHSVSWGLAGGGALTRAASDRRDRQATEEQVHGGQEGLQQTDGAEGRASIGGEVHLVGVRAGWPEDGLTLTGGHCLFAHAYSFAALRRFPLKGVGLVGARGGRGGLQDEGVQSHERRGGRGAQRLTVHTVWLFCGPWRLEGGGKGWIQAAWRLGGGEEGRVQGAGRLGGGEEGWIQAAGRLGGGDEGWVQAAWRLRRGEQGWIQGAGRLGRGEEGWGWVTLRPTAASLGWNRCSVAIWDIQNLELVLWGLRHEHPLQLQVQTFNTAPQARGQSAQG